MVQTRGNQDHIRLKNMDLKNSLQEDLQIDVESGSYSTIPTLRFRKK